MRYRMRYPISIHVYVCGYYLLLFVTQCALCFQRWQIWWKIHSQNSWQQKDRKDSNQIWGWGGVFNSPDRASCWLDLLFMLLRLTFSILTSHPRPTRCHVMSRGHSSIDWLSQIFLNRPKKYRDGIITFLFVQFAFSTVDMVLFSCPQQLKRWPCPLLACLLACLVRYH